jgi:hypothetical protein
MPFILSDQKLLQQQQQHQQSHSSLTTTTTVALQDQQKQQTRNSIESEAISPSYTFKSNKKGLPLVVQREIVSNVKLFKGLDDFVHEQCDKHPLLFGERNTQLRKADLSKRLRLVNLRDEQPKRFLELCRDFALLQVGEETKPTVVSEASSIGSEDTTVKHSNIKKQQEVERSPSPVKLSKKVERVKY